MPALFVLEMNALGRVDADEPALRRSRTSPSARSRSACARSRSTARTSRPSTRRRARRASTPPPGSGPVFLNVRTYRLVGHYIGDPQVYREKSELEELRETKDPIELLRARLGIGDEEFEALDTEIEAIVEGSVEFAKARHRPEARGRAQVRLCLS